MSSFLPRVSPEHASIGIVHNEPSAAIPPVLVISNHSVIYISCLDGCLSPSKVRAFQQGCQLAAVCETSEGFAVRRLQSSVIYEPEDKSYVSAYLLSVTFDMRMSTKGSTVLLQAASRQRAHWSAVHQTMTQTPVPRAMKSTTH